MTPSSGRSRLRRGVLCALALAAVLFIAAKARRGEPAAEREGPGVTSRFERPAQVWVVQRLAQWIPEEWLVAVGMRAAQIAGLFPGQLARARPLIMDDYSRMRRDPAFRRLPGVLSLLLSPRDPGHYFLYVPKDYDPAKKWPVIVFLHGWGGNSKYYPWWWSQFADEHGVIIVGPTFGHGHWERESGARDALDALARTTNTFSVDERRVFLAGQSNGGMGLWSVYARKPQAFAGLICISGALRAPEEAAEAARVPVLFIHGGRDANVPLEAGRRAARAVGAAGGRVEFLEFPDADHFVMAEERQKIYAALARWMTLDH